MSIILSRPHLPPSHALERPTLRVWRNELIRADRSRPSTNIAATNGSAALASRCPFGDATIRPDCGLVRILTTVLRHGLAQQRDDELIVVRR